MLGEILGKNRKSRPLIHCITNYVTANDCANFLLAAGASPIMADAVEEMDEIDAICAGHVLNMGTPNPMRIEAMLAAGRDANRRGHPIVFDPVGAGCSDFRRKAVERLLDEVRFQIIRGNADEICTLHTGMKTKGGVDAQGISRENHAEELAKRTGSIVIMTGNTDLVTDGRKSVRIYNGHPVMKSITGAGCQLSALTGAFAASNQEKLFEASIAAVCAIGLCGEIAASRMDRMDGNASCRNYIIDAMYNLTPEQLGRGAKYEVV